MTTVTHGKVGRPSKGLRSEMKVRIPVELRMACRNAARARGLTENDLVAALLAAHTGLSHLAPALTEELPLQKSA